MAVALTRYLQENDIEIVKSIGRVFMCLAVPAKVIEKKDMVADFVEVEGIRRDISLMLLQRLMKEIIF